MGARLPEALPNRGRLTRSKTSRQRALAVYAAVRVASFATHLIASSRRRRARAAIAAQPIRTHATHAWLGEQVQVGIELGTCVSSSMHTVPLGHACYGCAAIGKRRGKEGASGTRRVAAVPVSVSLVVSLQAPGVNTSTLAPERVP